MGGRGDKAIAEGLNRDQIPCPSAHRPEQNRHYSGDGWQAPTVAAILQNPRYTGYAVFGRWTKREELIDPDDVAAGYAIRFVQATADRIIRSRRPAHPQIVSVEQFTEAHLIRRGRAGITNRDHAKLERTRTLIPRPYLLRRHIRCDACNRKNASRTSQPERLLPLPCKNSHTRQRCADRSPNDRKPARINTL
ncbi:recombinase family protein [Nocardia sp. NPDC049149]|uniref:recombinase family protein n=1 Tax=Nocardia sp. NPDC049149 TaxID=3364315 RepID=UPI00371C1AA2